jgi:hypothetical protein
MPSPWTTGTALPAQAGQLNWIPAVSSNVQAYAYDYEGLRLFIRFKNGSSYAYDDVPQNVWDGLLRAGSKGRYVWEAIRGKGTDSIYAYRRF